MIPEMLSHLESCLLSSSDQLPETEQFPMKRNFVLNSLLFSFSCLFFFKREKNKQAVRAFLSLLSCTGEKAGPPSKGV